MTEQVVDTVLMKYALPDGNRPAKVWDQQGNDWAIWEEPLLNEVKMMIGPPVRLTGEIAPSRDGRFQNRTLRSVELANGAGMGMVTPAAMTPAPLFPTQPAEPTPEYQRQKHPDEQRAIRRAVALNNAVLTLPNLEAKLSDPNQVLTIAERWEQWLAGGS